MIKRNKIVKLFLNSGCLAFDTVNYYLTDRLNPEDKKSVEKHISECEFCAEAIEGYRKTDIKEPLSKTVEQLNIEIDKNYHSAGKKVLSLNQKIIAYSSLAASILILAGLFLVLKNMKISPDKIVTEKILLKDNKDRQGKDQENYRERVTGFSSDSVAEQIEIIKAIPSKVKEIPITRRLPVEVPFEPVIEATVEPQSVAEIIIAEDDLGAEAVEYQNIEIAETQTEHGIELASPVASKRSADKSRMKYAKKADLQVGQKYEKESTHVILSENNAEPEYQMKLEETDSFKYMEGDHDLEMDFVPFEEKEAGEEEVFIIVEDMPQFIEGDQNAFRKWIQQNLRYPEIAAENGISGRVFVQFVVNTKGKVVDARVIRGVDPALDKEALRVVNSSPKWQPGKQRGKPVKVQFTFPVVFVLQ